MGIHSPTKQTSHDNEESGICSSENGEEVRRQFNTISSLIEGSGKLDYATCVKIFTDASIEEMFPPGVLVMLTALTVRICWL